MIPEICIVLTGINFCLCRIKAGKEILIIFNPEYAPHKYINSEKGIFKNFYLAVQILLLTVNNSPLPLNLKLCYEIMNHSQK